MKLRFLYLFLLVTTHLSYSATVTVNSTGNQAAANPAVSPDSTAGVGIITLRSAFDFSQNGAVAPTTIIFDIPTTDPGFQPSTNSWRISPTTAMAAGAVYRAAVKQVIVDGYQGNTAHPAVPNTNPMELGSNAVLRIEIRGPGIINTIGSCFRIDGVNGCEIRGLCINRFLGFPAVAAGMAIRWTNSQNTIVAGNFLGTDITGMFDSDPSTGDFLGFLRVSQISSGHNSVYGGNAPADTNVIAGAMTENIIAFTTNNFTVRRNYIGTNKLGTGTFAHFGIGVEYEGGTGIIVDNNVISGCNDAMQLLAPDNYVVTNNKIGTNAAGTAILGNSGSGMLLSSEGAPTTSITVTNNLISGNKVGIRLGWNVPGENFGISGAVIQGNKIGTDVTGQRVLGNDRSGILVQGPVTNSLIGSLTQTLTEQNVISGNQEDGVRITEGASFNTVRLNKIGTNIIGNASQDANGDSFGNSLDGIRIGIGQAAASFNNV
jgi:hypothetical protein